jgi:hypothetical protein
VRTKHCTQKKQRAGLWGEIHFLAVAQLLGRSPGGLLELAQSRPKAEKRRLRKEKVKTG